MPMANTIINTCFHLYLLFAYIVFARFLSLNVFILIMCMVSL